MFDANRINKISCDGKNSTRRRELYYNEIGQARTIDECDGLSNGETGGIIVKRIGSLLVAFVLLLCNVAYARTADKLIPNDKLWSKSINDFKKGVKVQYTEVKVNKKQAIKLSDIDVDGYTMDGYYLFEENMRTHYGFSKTVFILTGTDKRSKQELADAYSTFVGSMEMALGKADTYSSNTATWQRDKYSVEIRTGDFKAYNKSKNKNVGIIITGLNMPTPEPSPTPKPASKSKQLATKTPEPTKTPKPALKEKDMTVHITAQCGDYNHVGNDWSTSFSINGNRVSSGSTIPVKVGDKITAKAVITENDSRPDQGSGKHTYKVTEKGIKNGFYITLDIVVREDKGRYAGNTCTWHVRFDFE